MVAIGPRDHRVLPEALAREDAEHGRVGGPGHAEEERHAQVPRQLMPGLGQPPAEPFPATGRMHGDPVPVADFIPVRRQLRGRGSDSEKDVEPMSAPWSSSTRVGCVNHQSGARFGQVA